MLGFGKKDKSSPEKPKEDKKQKKNKGKQQVIEAANISDDNFVVMPSQYLAQSKKPKAKGINKKLILLVGGSILILAAIGLVLYFVLFSGEGKSPSAPSLSTISPTRTQSPPVQAPVEDNEPDEPSIQEKIISTQAFSESNILVGSLDITVPATVNQEYGSGIGITVLDKSDISLPDEGQVYGGLYSAYPGGVTFEEPVSLEIAAADIPDSLSKGDIYPAYLRGVKWQEFDDYQVSLAGFTFTLERFPSGPITVIWNPDQDFAPLGQISASKPIPSLDTDLDGLTDSEEQLFGTSLSSVDSDEDTYQDLEEINNGYSPIAAEGALLAESGIFSTYTNSTYGYQVQYPSTWLADALDQTNKQILFISDTEEFFEILIEENPLNTPIIDWYRGQSPSLANIELEVFVLASRPAVWSPDASTLYTSKDGLIYIITYNSGTRDEISWPNVYEYFYTSFSFGNTNSSDADLETGDEDDAETDQDTGETGTTTEEVLE